ncbi:hypothetical protein pEaSNUABM28_00085 [Erwinia phage pEa_SNUABM_28]|uniref:Uncharacterized protein n=1 Tax=Erwinia phage pEa_SNUABM_16 TaxID=2869544 RepID=A0AAE8XQ09_9CAUD|nr:hypothetical protein MPK64_gp083 [Erwinia phage pEa_SNUABM_16]QZE58642.1 hypothetical protein pEaSNUABM28_00085 [Erwinia phage pEa_SNUABM_28]QZE58986.1 hypothetical protein pEaSNUABM18_00083 [Erwinia phage pEa_SNUABM_18]UAW96227.1 hypothetical protein pEaSNUABM16_00083 [Erwinia phage pEa_SNUABM_16]
MINNKAASLVALGAAFPASAIAVNTLHIGLFKGTRPQLSKALDLIAGTASLNFQTILTTLGAVQADFLGSVACSAMTPQPNALARTLTLPLGGMASTLTGAADGTPTYYIARICPANATATWAGFNYSSGITGPVWLGTVGAQGSDAELQFIGGQIKSGQAYRFLDLTLQL